jgi:hypothetical protein
MRGAFHLRHLDVHEDDIVGGSRHLLEHLQPGGGHLRLVAESPEQPERQLLVGGVVLGQEDPQGCGRRRARLDGTREPGRRRSRREPLDDLAEAIVELRELDGL